jgi:4-hydroxybenzoate polyprenyltransferase
MRRRSKLHAYLLLARVSNLPTVWTNVLAAFVAAAASRESLVLISIAVSLSYTAGMFLNDAFDADVDEQHRADRPIPSGDVTLPEVFGIGIALLVAGEALLGLAPFANPAMAWGIALAAAIVFYDYQHKGRSFGPVIMGACRALVYCVAAAAATGDVSSGVAIAAVVMWVYIIALTWVAKSAGLGHAVPLMLAGICLVDAVMIAAMGAPQLAVVAALGFPVTLALQRVVPGT